MNPADKHPDQYDTSTWWQRHRANVLRIVGLPLAAGVLVLSADLVTLLPCWGFFILIGLLAWPVWQYRTEYLLLRRRLVLAGVSRRQSRIRAVLWRGRLSQVFQVFVAIAVAWVLLALVAQLSVQHWLALAVDAVLLALLITPVARSLGGEVAARHLHTVARHWPLFLINGLVLTAAIMALDFFVVGAADSRHLAWHRVAVEAFAGINNQASCILWGVSAGLLASVEALAWHTSQLVIPHLPDRGAQLIAWVFFLLRATTVAYFYTALLLGVDALLEHRRARRRGDTRESTMARAFLLTIIVLALPFFYAAVKLNAIDPATFDSGVAGAAGLINPCQPNAAARERLIAKLNGRVEGQRRQAIQEADTRLEQELDSLFSDVEKGIDRYLDWYFTVFGEYQRLAAVFAKDLTAATGDKLQEYLFAPSRFDSRLMRLDREVEQQSAERFAMMAPQLSTEIVSAPCDIGSLVLAPLAELDRDTLRASAAATSGAGAGIVASKALAQKTAAAVAGKLAAKKSVQSGAALSSKALAKKGSSSLLSAGIGTALCAPSGPVAVICGVTAGLVTWLTVDKALIELDEALHREDMRMALVAVLAEQKAALTEQLRQKHHARVDNMAARVNRAVQGTFMPYSQGVNEQ